MAFKKTDDIEMNHLTELLEGWGWLKEWETSSSKPATDPNLLKSLRDRGYTGHGNKWYDSGGTYQGEIKDGKFVTKSESEAQQKAARDKKE